MTSERDILVGDEMHIRRLGVLPSWFRWQGLPVEVIDVLRYEIICRTPDGNLTSFRRDELVHEWTPIERFGPEGAFRVVGEGIRTPETDDSLAPGPKSLDQASGAKEVPRGQAFYDISCRWCKRAVDENWFGLPVGMAHCPRKRSDGTYCHATWTTANASHCVVCHRTFGSPSAANAHKRGSRCVDPAKRRNNKGEPYFGEPTTNQYGTVIWRTMMREDNPWTKKT